MLFNSLTFPVFLVVTYLLYWLVQGRVRVQNVLLLVASYVFYGWWDWRFLSLIAISSVADFLIGGRLGATSNVRSRRLLLLGSLGVNLGFLGFFKYFNFFLESTTELLSALGFNPHVAALNIILPVGISFYTFQTLSYTIDVYRGRIEPSRDWIAFFAYVSFFPQLVAGPIERASSLLPQFMRKRTFDEVAAADGLRQIAWGLFKKVVVADQLAPLVNTGFGDPGLLSGSDRFVVAFFFSIQIYCDFSGYSDIAIGVARLFGFSLMRNFAFPYYARDIAEFWRRWHISLTTWFRDYLYIPLGGSRGGKLGTVRNVLIVFVVSGFWHGANWTFLAWGALHALFYVPLLLRGRNRTNLDSIAAGRVFPKAREALALLRTQILVILAWVFFRADSIAAAWGYLVSIASGPWSLDTLLVYRASLPLACVLLAFEWFQREREHGLDILHYPLPVRRSVYAIVILMVAVAGAEQRWGVDSQPAPFIYFQF